MGQVIYSYDPKKAEANFARHGVRFEEAEDFEWNTALEFEDAAIHNEVRMVAIGMIRGKCHVLVYTVRDDTIRLISLRRAEPKERRRYHEASRQT